MTGTNRVTRVAGSVLSRLLTAATVTAVDVRSEQFRTIELTTDKQLSWRPGDKIRLAVSGLTLRTYTPTHVDGGKLTILAHTSADGPGSTWCRLAEVGQAIRILGPQKSLDLGGQRPTPIIVGDETALGLMLAQRTFDETAPRGVFEVDDLAAASAELEACGTDAELIVREPDDHHLDGMIDAVLDRLRADPLATLCLSGRAQSIAVIRRRLKDVGLAGRAIAVKAYWDVNRTGLD